MPTPQPRSVVVVGAGLAGMTAALTASDHGATVTVLEARVDPGGRARTLAVDGGFLLNQGAHALYRGGPALGRAHRVRHHAARVVARRGQCRRPARRRHAGAPAGEHVQPGAHPPRRTGGQVRAGAPPGATHPSGALGRARRVAPGMDRRALRQRRRAGDPGPTRRVGDVLRRPRRAGRGGRRRPDDAGHRARRRLSRRRVAAARRRAARPRDEARRHLPHPRQGRRGRRAGRWRDHPERRRRCRRRRGRARGEWSAPDRHHGARRQRVRGPVGARRATGRRLRARRRVAPTPRARRAASCSGSTSRSTCRCTRRTRASRPPSAARSCTSSGTATGPTTHAPGSRHSSTARSRAGARRSSTSATATGWWSRTDGRDPGPGGTVDRRSPCPTSQACSWPVTGSAPTGCSPTRCSPAAGPPGAPPAASPALVHA